MKSLAVCLLIASGSIAATLLVPSAYPTIQTAINAAIDGDSVLVSPGTYYEQVDFLGKEIAVMAIEGPSATTIDATWPRAGRNLGSAVRFVNGEGRGAVIEGFTLTGGAGSSLPGVVGWCGGGICCDETSPTILGNVITGNAVYPVSGSSGHGGGIYSNEGAPLIVGNLIMENSVAEGTALGVGGGIYHVLGEVEIRNNVICCNDASQGHGGGVYCYGPDTGLPCYLENNTIANNAAAGGGGLNCAMTIILRNTILWDNQADGGPEIRIHSWTTPETLVSIHYCDIEGGQDSIFIFGPGDPVDWGEGNIDLLPYFETGPLSDYHLTEGVSPCIDAGDPSPAYSDPEDTDNPGYALWPALGTVRNDMGAYGGGGAGYWTGLPEVPVLPTSDAALMAFPNPFSGMSALVFEIPEQGNAEIMLCDIFGRVIRILADGEFEAGHHAVVLYSTDLPSGIYLCRLQAGNAAATCQVVLIR